MAALLTGSASSDNAYDTEEESESEYSDSDTTNGKEYDDQPR